MPYAEAQRRTPNLSPGTNECKGVVFHHTAGSYAGSVAWLTDRRAKASAHVVIAKDGRRTVLAPDTAITWHAGRSVFRGRSGCNAFMLGVEFELTREDVAAGAHLTDAQIQSALEWLRPRWTKHRWSLAWMTDHRAVSPDRKIDLSPANWQRLKIALAAEFGEGAR